MKLILVANTDWYLYNYRLALANVMRQQGFEVVLISPKGDFSEKLAQSGFRWIEWNVGRTSTYLWEEIMAIYRLVRIYQAERPDLVHHFTTKTILYGTLAARMAGVRCLVNSFTGRGYVFFSAETKARLLRPLVDLLFRLLLGTVKSCNIFENQSDQQFYVVHHMVAPGRAWIIPGVGVDAEKFSPAPELQGIPVVTYAGRLLWNKGIGTLIDAGRLLKEQGQAFRLALVGAPDTGNLSSIDENTIRKWVEDGDVEWWGFRDDMEKVYQQSHIVVLPSYSEGVPTTLMEAAAAGRPLVATDLPGCREVIQPGKNGILIPLRDPAALALALGRLLGDPGLRQSMGAAGRQIVLSKFTNETINQQTREVYRKALAG